MKMKKLTNWRVDELASPMYARVMAECEKGSAYIVCVMCGGIKDDPKGTKRANQIVKAVNSHDALVEALSEAADIMESMGCPKRAVRSWRELVEKGSEA